MHIAEEIITGKRSRQHDVAACEAHLKLALVEPVGKVGSVKAAARLAARAGSPERLCARSKPEKPCLACVGFTLNVNRKPGIDYAAVAASAPDVRVVAYLRTNRVKAAVSRVRGKLLDAVCGYNNIRVGDNKRAKEGAERAPKKRDARADWSTGAWRRHVVSPGELQPTVGHCKLNATLPVDVGEIKDALLVNWHWEAAMLGVVDTLRARNVSVRMVAYEHFLEDRDRALAGLFDFLGVPPDARPPRRADVYEKATSDDLQSFVPNYGAIEAWLAAEAPCLLPHLRETDPGRVFDAASCPNAWPDAVPSVAKSDRHHGSEKKRKIDPDV